VHNDIKLDNLTLGSFEKEQDANFVNIIDFGASVKYRDNKGSHVKESEHFEFEGNIILSTIN